MPVRPAFLAALALTLPAAAQAQAGQWEVVAQPGRSRVASVKMPGIADGIALTCNGSTPVMGINLLRAPARDPARATISVDGEAVQLSLSRNPGTSVWFTILDEQRLLHLMAGGSSGQVSIEGADYGTASMSGAQTAFSDALAGCYQATVSVANEHGRSGGTATSLPPAALAAWETASRARCRLVDDRFVARTFTPSPYSAADPGQPDDNFVAADLNGDGQPDFALVTSDFGCSQQDYVSYTDFVVSGPTGYRMLEGFSGKESVVEARRCGDREVVVLHSGAMWGWQDDRVDYLGTVDRCSALAQASAGAAGRSRTGRGALSTIPMKLGYYVPEGEPCGQPSSVMKFEADGFWVKDDEGAFNEKIASVASEEGAYVLRFANVPPVSVEDEVEPVSEIIVIPEGPGRILVQINGDGYMTFCEESDIPQRLKI